MSDRDEALQRLRKRLDAEPDLGTLRASLRTVPGARRGAYERVRRRLDAPVVVRRRAPWGVAALALTAVLVWFVVPRPLDRELSGAQAVRIDRHVRADWDGAGHVSGVRDAPRIEWTTGTLRVDVDPHEGVDLVVTTREAEVRVVGTIFVVDRDVHGTRVRVERGKVEVACVRGVHAAVEAGGELLCVPADPAGVLAAARAAEAEGADAAALIEVLGAPAGTGDVRRELDVMRCGALRSAGRLQDALTCVDMALATPGDLRRDELLRTGAAAALAANDCARARSWLDLLADPRGPALLANAGCDAAR